MHILHYPQFIDCKIIVILEIVLSIFYNTILILVEVLEIAYLYLYLYCHTILNNPSQKFWLIYLKWHRLY